jgi:methionine transaminase
MDHPVAIRLTSKLPDVGTTIFTVMSQLATDVGAVNLGQGFPDFDCDPRLLDLLDAATRAGHNQYPPMIGVPQLREAVAEKVATLYTRQYDPAREITITAGATQAIHTALTAIVHPGDEVIIFEPVYDSYEPVIRLNGGVAVFARLSFPDFRPDFAALAALITPRTRAIVINSPHNPTATMWSRQDLEQLAAMLRNTDIVLISDEVYEHMVYDGEQHQSVSSVPALAERAFVISSFGKTYHVTGWKIAYCLAPAPLMAEFRKAHQFVVFTVHTPSQHALARYMALRTHETLPAFYQAKRDHFAAAVSPSRFTWLPSRSTYFMLARYDSIPDLAEMPDTAFAMHLAREYGVVSIPLSAFYPSGLDNRVLRFCFAKKEDTLNRAAAKLRGV